ncbi:MAG: hypothetical protein AB7V16_12310 [Vulcanibacillus sp.]
MERKLIKSKTKIYDYVSTSKKFQFSKIIYNSLESKEDYINEIIDELKTSNNITFYIKEFNLPEMILNEIKWLKYYGYNTRFLVNSEKIKYALKEYSNDFVVDESVNYNLIEVLDNNPKLYLLKNQEIIKLITRSELIKNSLKEKNKIMYFTGKDKVQKNGFDSIKLFYEVEKANLYLKKNPKAMIAITDKEHAKFKSNYLGLGSKLFMEFDFQDKKYYQLCEDEIIVFINDVEDGVKTYTIVGNELTKYNTEDTKAVDIIDRKADFTDFEVGNMEIDVEQEILKYGDYNKFSINYIIQPPYISEYNDYVVSSRYDRISNALYDVKKRILKNLIIDNNIIYDEELVTIIQNIKSFVSDKNDICTNIKELNQLSKEFENSNKLKNVLKSNFIKYVESTRNNFSTGISKIEKEILSLSNKISQLGADNSKEYIRLNDELYHLTSIKNDYFEKYVIPNEAAFDIDKFIENRSINQTVTNKSLGRILYNEDLKTSTDNIHHRLLRSMASILVVSEIVCEIIEEINKYDIPKVGILYESPTGLGLVIKYEDEISDAKIIVEKFKAKLFVEKENII